MSISLTQGRFFAIQKTEQHNRKHIQVLNKIERKRTDFLTRQIDKTRQAEEYRVKQQREKLRKSLSKIDGLRRGLMRKLSLQNQSQSQVEGDMKSNYGRYGGMSLDAIKKDTDRWFKPKDPKVERKKKSQDLLREGRRDGRIIAYESLPAILSLPEQRKEKERERARRRPIESPETPEKSPIEYDPLTKETEKSRRGWFETVRKRRRNSTSPRLKLPPLTDFKETKEDTFSFLKPPRDDSSRLPSLGNKQDADNHTGKRDASTETELPPLKSHKSVKGNHKTKPKAKQWNKGAHGVLPPLIES